MKIYLGDFTFHGDEFPDASGFTVAAVSGWADGPGQRRETSPRPGAPGSFDVVGVPTDHVVSWRGRYHGTSTTDVMAKARSLSGLAGVGARMRVTVDWDGLLWADARVDRVRFEPQGAMPFADYQVELWLADPRKYGTVNESVSTGATVTASHGGTYPATPLFKVAGTFPNGYALHADGKVVQVAGSASAVTDYIDFRTGMVTRNGSMQPILLQQGQFWSVPGNGVSMSWRFDPFGGSGTATCYVTDTYI